MLRKQWNKGAYNPITNYNDTYIIFGKYDLFVQDMRVIYQALFDMYTIMILPDC